MRRGYKRSGYKRRGYKRSGYERRGYKRREYKRRCYKREEVVVWCKGCDVMLELTWQPFFPEHLTSSAVMLAIC